MCSRRKQEKGSYEYIAIRKCTKLFRQPQEYVAMHVELRVSSAGFRKLNSARAFAVSSG
jgi:ribosomal protein S26